MESVKYLIDKSDAQLIEYCLLGLSERGRGVHGSSGSGIGVDGYSNRFIGVSGRSISNIGVYGRSISNIGVYGYSDSYIGVRGWSDRHFGVHGYSNRGYGLYAYSTSGIGVFGASSGADGYAAYLDGRVYIRGPLEKPAGSFKIDHPLDPANKYLSHSFVESPDIISPPKNEATTYIQIFMVRQQRRE